MVPATGPRPIPGTDPSPRWGGRRPREVTGATAPAWELEPSLPVAYGSTVTAESIDEAPARDSTAGRTTGQSSTTRRGASARRSTATTAAPRAEAGSTGAASSDAEVTGPEPTGPASSPVTTGSMAAGPVTAGSLTAGSLTTGSLTTGSVTAGADAASASGGLSTIPTPADPPTTELRSTLARPAEPPYGVTDRVPVAGPLPSNIYRARRPGVAILLIIPAVAVGVLLVRALATAAFGDSFDIAGILASVSALVSLPFLVAGLYGLISGAAHGAEQYGFRVWARPPLAYLLVGLAFVAAAGLATG